MDYWSDELLDDWIVGLMEKSFYGNSSIQYSIYPVIHHPINPKIH